MSPKDFLKLINDQQSSRELDQILGLKESLHSKYNDQEEAYSDGLTGSDALYTSYQDLLMIRQDLMERNLKDFGDLGAGNCRSKILFDYLESPFKSTAYEFVPERIKEAKATYQQLGLKEAHHFIEGDLKDCSLATLEAHDAFFIYLPVGPTLEKLVEKFKELSLHKKLILYVIESHGDLIDYLQDHLEPLRVLKKLELSSQRHIPELYVFELGNCAQQMNKEKDLLRVANSGLNSRGEFSLECYGPREMLFLFKSLVNWQYLQLLIREDDFEWLACLEGWRYGIQKDTVETIHPYRIHYLNQVKALIVPDKVLLPYITERRDTFKPPLSSIRKIKVKPTLEIERANGTFEKI